MSVINRRERVSRVRAINRHSAVRVSKLKEPGLYEDGGGLRLIVTDKRTKRWALRLTIRGRRVERGLGTWPLVSLDDARIVADRFRRAAKEGRDERKERAGHLAQAWTFKDAFEAFFGVRCQQLTNGRHIRQWQNTMRDYVFPHIGDRPVAEIASSEVFDILEPIWFLKPETGSRVLQRMRAVFDSAIVRGMREKANPCLGVAGELGSNHRKVTHHRALPWQDVPAFVHALRTGSAKLVTRLLFEFLILTAARSGEARGALWSEFDLSARVWTIPGLNPTTGRRMKGGCAHTVPLSSRALAILAQARGLHSGDLVFPGTLGQPLSDNTLSKLMRDADAPGTPHGFRSAFKDWAAEAGVRDEVSEAALAHSDRDKVRAAYRRTRFLEERKILMERWSEYVVGKQSVIDRS